MCWKTLSKEKRVVVSEIPEFSEAVAEVGPSQQGPQARVEGVQRRPPPTEVGQEIDKTQTQRSKMIFFKQHLCLTYF